MMLQYKSADGLSLDHPRSIGNVLPKFLEENSEHYTKLPDGLVGIDLDTGLAKVILKTDVKKFKDDNCTEVFYKSLR